MKVLELKPIMLIQIVITILALGLFVYLAITDNMVVAPLFFMSLSLCFLISGFRLFSSKKETHLLR